MATKNRTLDRLSTSVQGYGALTATSSTPSPLPNVRRRILWISLALVGAQLIGSAFNIWYNLSILRPLLEELQWKRFANAIQWYNGTIYPVATAIWIGIMGAIARTWRRGDRNSPAWQRATRRTINLPWIAIAVSGAAWFLSIPVFLVVVHGTPIPLDPEVNLHLPVSIVIAALIAIGIGFFAVELLTQKLLYPLFLTHSESAADLGAHRITLKRRGLIWAISAVACPILALMLLFIVGSPESSGARGVWFPIAVGTVGIAFGLVSAWLLARIVIEPIEVLGESARRVGEGDLDTRVDLLRTDEFGVLIDRFNGMVTGLREKRRVEGILGRNVGMDVARLLLERDDALKGTERTISVLFTDIRGFTPRCSVSSPQEVVTMLNIFFDVMVPEIESRHGIVNQFVGDGFMAIFGAIEDANAGHQDDAAAAGCAMIAALPKVNALLKDAGLEPLAIGVGVHSGPAVVGSIGTSGRTSFTAIGDTVNVAARIESLTKEAGYPLLISASTYEALAIPSKAEKLPPMAAKGKDRPLTVYGIR